MRLLTRPAALFAAAVCSTIPALADFSGGAFVWDSGDGPVPLYASTRVSLHTLGGSSGGPFKAVNRGGGDGTLPFYDDIAPGQELFKTFCVESKVTFNPGNYYWVSVDPVAYSGSAGITGDPISDVTEWIYDTWKADNPYSWSARETSRAIWYAEEEIGGEANAVWDAALSALSYGAIPDRSNLNPAAHTQALNLWKNLTEIDGVWYAGDVQSQLVTIPAPGAASLGLLGIGLVALIRRRA